MIQGIDVNQRIEFTLSRDVTEPKTIFVLKPLSGFEMMDSQERSVKEMVSKNIVEIKGAEDKTAFLNSLTMPDITELLKKINEINGVTEQDAKN